MIGFLRPAFVVAAALLVSGCVTNILTEKASRFDEGSAAYDAGDYPTAYRIWSQLAEENDLAAMRNTAQLLRQGKGVQKDSRRAFKLYLDAAEKNLVTAMANVGDMYLAGEGTERNPQAAAAWYARAATAGLSIAQVKMADLYEQGIGVDRDPARARALIERAARNGYVPAQERLKRMGVVVQSDLDTEASENPNDPWRGGGTTRAESVAATAATAGASTARPRLSPGDPVTPEVTQRMPPQDQAQMHAAFVAYAAQNKRLAFATWRNVAVRGNPEAQLRVGLMYETGEGVGQDMIEAYRWLKLASNQGHLQASGELSFVAAQLAPAERAIAESLVRLPPEKITNPP